MKAKWLLPIAAGVSLMINIGTRADDPVRVFGLEFTVISNATMTVDQIYPLLHVDQTNIFDCYDYGTGSNEVARLPFGASVSLGEAQSGVYIYPGSECRGDNVSMWGYAYGNVNGETNRLISFVKGTRVYWGYYRVEVDLTPLGATSYIYQVWWHGTKTLQSTNQCPLSSIITSSIEDRNPRVNPFHLTEAGPAAIIEFPYGTQFALGNDGSDSDCGSGQGAIGDRIIIIAEGATNQVNYVSRVDVFGSDNLTGFTINDARIGMFGRPHKALGTADFAAANGRLRAGPFEPVVSSGWHSGVLVDFKQNAVRWTVGTEPFPLDNLDGHFLLNASGLAFSGSPSDRYWGPAGFTKSNGVLRLSADWSALDATNSVLRVFRSNELSGSIVGPSGAFLATLAQTNPLVTGWTVTTQALSISIAEPAVLTGYDGTVLEGDRFEFAPQESPVVVAYIKEAPILAQGITNFTIISESTEDYRVPEPRLQIDRAPTGLMVSWPYLDGYNPIMRTDLSQEPYEYLPFYSIDFRSYVIIEPTNAMSFISLRHYSWYYSNP